LILASALLTWDHEPVAALDPNAAAGELIALTNLNRTINGLHALLVEGGLNATARGRSDDMIARNYFSHQIPPDSTTVVDLLRTAGIPFRSVGENIAWNTAPELVSVQRASNDFMNSPGHRAQIMNARYDRVGAGVAEGLPKRMYTVVFIGAPTEEVPVAPPPEPAISPTQEPEQAEPPVSPEPPPIEAPSEPDEAPPPEMPEGPSEAPPPET